MATFPDHLVVGRFAPSPTGALHTGSLVAAVGSYLMAKQGGGRWVLRLDDLDRSRQVPGMADDILRTLESFGLLWDGEVAFQSRHQDDYQHFFELLQQAGSIYPCSCSRKEIARSASAPHPGDEGVRYPGSCRDGKTGAAIRSWRVRAPEAEICFSDLRNGRYCQKLSAVSGDFVIRRGDGEFAYQLAVVVDDYLAGVNQVVRGDDLLSSTPRQIYLQKLLGLPQPDYCHLPLVTGPDGLKLSKRDHLISSQLGNVVGRERSLLFAVLHFLGQNPPAELAECPPAAILEWGATHFQLLHLPAHGGTLGI
ncbi:MAG: tRNA glutamyl-Q(34) synthetase GluQRS [Desulfuromonadaceae bacterium]|nr:tRNA glutamyl-Q(34) synthetase GluQRS [Desulfuromonadaceae bacterium]MDD2848428.1 tRNA glutamyl-Q(34) synthetase GluQRS [Desulfuromonadaceae bacterium]MDD4129943.1 tRNA glutamyl-Q(34) synthetase GluQRS [Desulfuromonadaceae bacterium]